jgi:hypothetical protein
MKTPLRFIAVCALFLLPVSSFASPASPVVFWASDSLQPGDAVLFYGGGLAGVRNVRLWQLPNGDAMPAAQRLTAPDGAQVRPALQAVDASLKFSLPENLAPGVYAAQVPGGVPIVLNRPEAWFLQPEHLQPGLRQSQAAPGSAVQIIGKDFMLPNYQGKPRIVMRPADGGPWREVALTKADKFSLLATLPADLPAAHYQLRVSNGFGGAVGWSDPLTVEIKQPDAWPATLFNVKQFGAKGDDVTDDTAAIRSALDAAQKNGGGVVYFPWGTYRLKDWIFIPPRTVLRGDERDATILKWPVDEPMTLADFTPAAVYGQGSYGVENLSFITRKVNATFIDLGLLDKIPGDIPPELKPRIVLNTASHDVFFRHVLFQHWLMASHPDRNKALWSTKYTGEGSFNFRCNRVINFEVSDCIFQGGNQVFNGIENGRILNNFFGNEMGYCWTCLGGGAHFVVADGNEIRASSSWGYGSIGMQYVYSAHNRSYNFVRGEREAMTLDISALPATPQGANMPKGNAAWFGSPAAVDGPHLTLNGIKAVNNEFAGMTVMILNGPGAGEYRTVTANTPTDFTLDRPWDIPPDSSSTIGVWQLMRHMIVYQCEGYDCSAFAQLYGSFYDYIVDSCHVERTQGIWGQSGWFVQFRYNDVLYAYSYHKGIGPHGPNPEGNLPYSLIGLTDGNLRITKFGSTQYGVPGGKAIFVKDVLPHPVPGARGCIVKGNTLSYNQRVAFRPGNDPMQPSNPKDFPMMTDMIVDHNKIDHSEIGIYIGRNVGNVLTTGNQFTEVAQPIYANPRDILSLETPTAPPAQK